MQLILVRAVHAVSSEAVCCWKCSLACHILLLLWSILMELLPNVVLKNWAIDAVFLGGYYRSVFYR